MDRAILRTIAALVRRRVKREGLGAIDPGLREPAARVVSHHGKPAVLFRSRWYTPPRDVRARTDHLPPSAGEWHHRPERRGRRRQRRADGHRWFALERENPRESRTSKALSRGPFVVRLRSDAASPLLVQYTRPARDSCRFSYHEGRQTSVWVVTSLNTSMICSPLVPCPL
jgi:hypothetical protein